MNHWAILAFIGISIVISEWQAYEAIPVLRDVVDKPVNPFKTKEWLREWRKVRYRALVRDKGRCQCCGRTAQDGVRMEVDHCLPKSKYPLLSLELSNLATLCADCNRSKSDTDETHWRDINGH